MFFFLLFAGLGFWGPGVLFVWGVVAMFWFCFIFKMNALVS